MPVIWQDGSTLLRDYSPLCQDMPSASAVLFVPSLINRYYILDLAKEQSFLRFLAAQDIPSMVIDWQEPGRDEELFDCGDYVTERLNKIITYIHHKTGQPVVLAGYCMGGMMALAASLQPETQNKIKALALLATPWDFHADKAPHATLSTHIATIFEAAKRHNLLSKETVHQLFYMLHSTSIHKRFKSFSHMDINSKEAKEFISIEQWANDSVPMTLGVAKDCFIHWAQDNTPMHHQWVVGDRKILPENIEIPTFIATPAYDRIVPTDCTEPLKNSLKYVHRITPPTGHVGMVAGMHAQENLWKPFLRWLHTL